MIAPQRLLKLESDTTALEPDTGVVLNAPSATGLADGTLIIQGKWRGDFRLYEIDRDEEATRLIWALLDHLQREDAERLRVSAQVADESSQFPSQFSEPDASP